MWKVILFPSPVSAVRLALTALIGVVGGMVLVMTWWRFGSVLACAIVAGLILGFLISSIIFFTPLGKKRGGGWQDLKFNPWSLCSSFLFRMIHVRVQMPFSLFLSSLQVTSLCFITMWCFGWRSAASCWSFLCSSSDGQERYGATFYIAVQSVMLNVDLKYVWFIVIV